MTTDEALDLLQDATMALARDAAIKDRLCEAFSCYLVQLEPQALPEELRIPFLALHAALMRETPQPRESSVRASVRKMSTGDAARYASLVVQIFAQLARSPAGMAAAARRKVRPATGSAVVELFAAEG